ncbi:putative phosphoglycerate mutase [Motilibacter rhizosphaerae]|uniref:Putative phosphoglycerate mutase n=1 Tax=Motilibacter rhizosphaerae TaxID=598652 RepID=A0A4Q7NS20_9ACTN|nr:bifunctional RNase H/acid phosphatase [Motilibacter rhizosphaerae]RZS89640.1 putative phosphoglycerate mutase [Motilibacter rhizosphaerae]
MRRLVVEADGGSRGNPGPAGYGAVVKDAATGEVLAERAEGIGTATNNVAEYRGLIAGLRAAAEIDPDASVEVRMDSKLVVEQMSGRWQVKHPSMKPLAQEARGVLRPDQVSYGWIPRERNKHADRLANEAMDAAARGQQWAPRVPTAVAVDEAELEPATGNRLVGWEELPAPTTFLLVRHGETPNTVAKLFCGRDGADPGLTERGRAQARAAGELLRDAYAAEEPVAVVHSPLRRAAETAAEVAAVLGLQTRSDPAFAEAAFGEWDGLDFGQVRERFPQQLQAWLDSPAVAPPGGESLDDVAARVRTGRDRLLARYPGRTVVLVSHVTPIKQLVRLALDAPASSVFRMELSPGSLALVRWWPDGGSSLQAFGVATHLVGPGREGLAAPAGS